MINYHEKQSKKEVIPIKPISRKKALPNREDTIKKDPHSLCIDDNLIKKYNNNLDKCIDSLK